MTGTHEGPLVHRSVDRRIATITLDSPHNRNALSRRLVSELTGHLTGSGSDPEVRAVVLTHTGTTFCAGADLSEAAGGTMSEAATVLLGLIRTVIDLPVPVLAKVDGNVRAGGVGLIGACDIVVAGPRATFALTEVRLGLAPAVISVALLPRLDDRAASRYFLTGETFDSAEAARIGLATIAADDVDAAVEALSVHLGKGSPQGLAESKRLATEAIRTAIDSRGDRMVELSARLFSSEEAREGMTAFLERRQPRWIDPDPDHTGART